MTIATLLAIDCERSRARGRASGERRPRQKTRSRSAVPRTLPLAFWREKKHILGCESSLSPTGGPGNALSSTRMATLLVAAGTLLGDGEHGCVRQSVQSAQLQPGEPYDRGRSRPAPADHASLRQAALRSHRDLGRGEAGGGDRGKSPGEAVLYTPALQA